MKKMEENAHFQVVSLKISKERAPGRILGFFQGYTVFQMINMVSTVHREASKWRVPGLP